MIAERVVVVVVVTKDSEYIEGGALNAASKDRFLSNKPKAPCLGEGPDRGPVSSAGATACRMARSATGRR